MNAPSSCLDRRRAGVLLHVTSLPGDGPTGDLGPDAYRFVDFLAQSGCTVWQMLPVGPVGGDGSPYQSSSAHAGDLRLVSMQTLAHDGLLSHGDVSHAAADGRAEALVHAYGRFQAEAADDLREYLYDFERHHAYWLDDFALFQALHEEHQAPWWEWPEAQRDRDAAALHDLRTRLAERLSEIRFAQFLFFRQWATLKAYANERGVRLFGDMPIFVAHDSAEVWAQRRFFHLDDQGQPYVVAGVPPDYFSATGQRWGNPLYRWDALSEEAYAFWVDRVRTQLSLYDLIRIDHFRGFEAYWEIPASEPNAIQGKWVKGPEDGLFDRLRECFGDLPLVAEDLGVITDEVRALRDRQAMPGMRILQFAFSGGPDNPYLPFHHTPNSVVYTGTHDNDTTLGWYQSLSDDERALVDDYLGHSTDAMPWPLIQQALLSRARLAILPMQDLLALDGAHRMNLPGTTEGNWRWRFAWEQLPDDLAGRFRRLLWMSGREVAG